MTNDELAAKIDARFEAVEQKMDARFEAVEKKMEEGFDASRARDEELRTLTKFGLEAREILRDEIHRRFDESDRKTDLQVTLLRDAVAHLDKHT